MTDALFNTSFVDRHFDPAKMNYASLLLSTKTILKKPIWDYCSKKAAALTLPAPKIHQRTRGLNIGIKPLNK